MNIVKRDWDWADRYIPAIKAIIGPLLISQASLAVDRNQATDLIVLKGLGQSIACRIRRSGFRASYAKQFTLRSKRDSGAETEMSKIAKGWGDLLFYAFADEKPMPSFHCWNLIDLRALRGHLILNGDRIETGEINNSDGTYFRYFNLDSFPLDPPILVASSSIQMRLK